MSRTLIFIFLNVFLLQTVYSQGINRIFPPSTFGTDWMVFLDATGYPRYINLTYTINDIKDLEKTEALDEGGRVRFFLYTKKGEDSPEELKLPEKNSKFFAPKEPVFILVHGWLSYRNFDLLQLMKTEILRQHNNSDNVNVIIMDWFETQSYDYIITAKKTEQVGEILCNFVMELKNKFNLYGNTIHIIGHCLGAHIAGLAGKQLKKKNNVISRITGLDPARPYFEFPMSFYPGITKESAKFVDIIHTSAGKQGVSNAVGQVDFYPNGGGLQTACCENSIEGLKGTCEHNCAYLYYAKSFNNLFEAVKCQDYSTFSTGACDVNEKQYMGEPCTAKAQGLFFLDIVKLDNVQRNIIGRI